MGHGLSVKAEVPAIYYHYIHLYAQDVMTLEMIYIYNIYIYIHTHIMYIFHMVQDQQLLALGVGR